MKKLTLLAFILALVIGASAETVNFAALPMAKSPTLLPNGYTSLDWANFYYVDATWSGAGTGFKQGPNSLDVAFMGGGICELTAVPCSASISSAASAIGALGGFTAQSAIVAAGYHSETINVSAYNHGHFVGSQNYNLTTSLQQINFPVSWGTITQLVMDTTQGTVVLYALNVQSVGATAQAMSDGNGVGATASKNIVGPTAPKGVIDPIDSVAADSINGTPILQVGPTAPKDVRPIARSSQSATAGGGAVDPPVQKVGPTAPGGVIDPLGSAAADGVIGTPILQVGPTAPKDVRPIARSSQSATANDGALGPPVQKVGPTAPTQVRPIARSSQSATADDGAVGPPVQKIDPTAPKQVRPIARNSESTTSGGSSAGSLIEVTGPTAPKIGPTAPDRGKPEPD